MPKHGSTRSYEKVRTALGLASIGLGLAAALAPRRFGRALGVKGRAARDGIFDFGLVQLAAGATILHDPRGAGNLWVSIGEEAFDLAALGGALLGTRRPRRAAALLGGVGALMLADILAARRIETA